MNCEKCGKNPATTHLKQTVNGETTQQNLCEECSKGVGFSIGLESIFDIGFGINQLLGSTFSAMGEVFSNSDMPQCEGCGMTYQNIMKTAKVGCAKCYEKFERQMTPSLQNIHGFTEHVGKIPVSCGETIKRKKEIEQLKLKLATSIEKQEFEIAVELRDRIKELEQNKVSDKEKSNNTNDIDSKNHESDIEIDSNKGQEGKL